MSEKLNLKFTGNVFVDSGIYAVASWFKIDISDITINHLKELAKEISNIYTTEKWTSNMHSIFPNSKLVNPSFRGNRKEAYYDELDVLIKEITPIKDEGNCISCGCRDSIKLFQKRDIPLLGSGSLKNYFPFGNEGADYCPLCALLVQFSPLVFYFSALKGKGKFMLLHSNSDKVMKYWSKQSIKNIKNQSLTNEFTGCYDEGMTNSINAIFRIIQNIIFSYDERWYEENPSLNFYYFDNFNQNPYLDIYHLPTSVFKFLAYIPQDEHSNWVNIVNSAYWKVNWENVEGFDDYKNKYNGVYYNLLNNYSILRYFFDSKSKKVKCSWNLVKFYMKEVRNMDEERLDSIKSLGEKLAVYIEENNQKKVLYDLETANSYYTFRNILRKILKDKISNGDGELLFTFDDYVNNLFPEGYKYWTETQDLLLFKIYENLHVWLVQTNNENEINEMEEN